VITGPLPFCAQSSSGAASTLERLTKETDTNITRANEDVAAKKNLVRGGEGVWCVCLKT
jgi:hypothetical protein